jgi:hypothetical protein
MYNKLNQAHRRPMTARERFGLLLFILQFLISKFGIFIVFLSFNIIGNTRIQNHQISPESFGTNPGPTLSLQVAKHPVMKTAIQPHENMMVGISSPALFSKLKMYCIIATIVTLFLNPQQTKYFGGLAVALKQAGLFSKYGKSEKTVYIFSWIFIVLFAHMSYSVAFLENTVGIPPRIFPVLPH